MLSFTFGLVALGSIPNRGIIIKMIQIVEGSKEEFVKECNELEKQNIFPIPETHRVFEFGGKIIYSVILAEGETIIQKKRGGK